MNATEIEKVLDALGVDKVRTSGNNVIGCCPIHGERNPSFGVSVAKEAHVWGCFSCGAKGPLHKLVMDVQQCSKHEALRFLAQFGTYEENSVDHDALATPFDKRLLRQQRGGVPVERETLGAYPALNTDAKLYLLGRGVSLRTQQRADLRVDVEDRSVLFVWYEGLLPWGITRRSYAKSFDKYRGLPLHDFKKQQHVYFAAGAVTRTFQTLYICEGEISALRVQSLGFNACALSSMHMTCEQADVIAAWTDKAFLLLDRGASMRAANVRALKRLAQNVPVFYPTRLPKSYQDPADCDKAELRKLLGGDRWNLMGDPEAVRWK